MIITNDWGIPAPIIQAINDGYQPSCDPNRYSVTELIGSPRYVHLRRRHWDELEQDASEMVWLMLGTAVHEMLEKAAPDNCLVEEYFRTPVGEHVASGMADLYEIKNDRGILSDYKTTSVWGRVHGDLPRIEHVKQLNCYAHMYREAGFRVDVAQVVTIYRDWSRAKAKYNRSYPPVPIEVHPIPLWPDDEAEAYMLKRLQHLARYVDTPDEDLPLCSEETRWTRDTVWAVHKQGRKRAVKLFDNVVEADRYSQKDPAYYVDMRPGLDARCLDYCAVASLCDHGRRVIAENGE